MNECKRLLADIKNIKLNKNNNISNIKQYIYQRCYQVTKNIVVKAYYRISLLFRGFFSGNLHVFRQAYITYIRPLLEYASNVWSPHLLMHINSIERVQRHFTNRITELRDFSYHDPFLCSI